MSALPGILTTNSVCVTKVQSPASDDLTICSENAIHLDTPHLLIQDIPIREHVRNIIFKESPGATKTYHRTVAYPSTKENVLNLGTYEFFDSIDAMNITSSENYMDVGGTNKESYVHLKTVNALNIQTPVYNQHGDEIIDYTDNIILKNTSGQPSIIHGTEVFKNYLYSLVNEALVSPKTGGFSETSYTEKRSDYEFYVENMGEYFTNTVITNKITTENVKYVNTQPRLTVKSGSAINLDAPVIMINGKNLDELIKQLLDENGLITISTILNNFDQISFTLDLFEVDIYTTQFTYDIKFDLILRDATIVNVDVTRSGDTFVFNPSITQFIKGTTYVFNNSANKDVHPLAFHNNTNRDTPTYLYMQNSSGIVEVRDFSEYDYLYHITITVGSKPEYVQYMDKNLGGGNWTVIEVFSNDTFTDTTAITRMLDNNYSTVVFAYNYYYFKNSIINYSSTEIVDQILSSNNPGHILWLNTTKHEQSFTTEIPVYPNSIRINGVTDGHSSATAHIFPSVEPDKYYNMYANVINTHTNTTLSSKLLLHSNVIMLTPFTLALSNDLTFNVVQYNIIVNVVSTAEGSKYEFDPPVTSFKRGDTYVFDNTLNSGGHPLNFHSTNNRGETFIYQQNVNGFVTVNNFSDYDVLFAHCEFHANMGSIVNNDTSGISVINSSHPRQYYVTLTVTNFNGGGFSIDTINPPTMTDASYDRFDNDKLYFTFNNATTAVNKNLYVKVIDSSGITEELTQEYIFPSDHIPMFTNQSFTFTSINSYGYSFRLNGTTYHDSSPFPSSTIVVTPPAPFVDGTINASIEFTNAYGFNRVYSLGSQTVTKPTAASQLKLERTPAATSISLPAPISHSIGSVSNGWTQILYLEGGSGRWFSNTGNLDSYSGGEFLFITGDSSRWLIASHFQVKGENYGNNVEGPSYRTVTASSENPTPHQLLWYNRAAAPEDPWISLEDHDESARKNTMMFAENGNSKHHLASINNDGMYVYTRNLPPITYTNLIKATYYKDGDDGNPVDTRPSSVSVYLYYQKTTASNPIVSRTNYEGYVNITLNTTVDLNVSSPNAIYSFIICKEYDNYGFIDSEVYYSNQLEVSSVVSFILGQSIKDLNNGTYSGSSQTLTWRNVTINDTGTANTNFQNQEGYKINTRDDKKYFEVNRVNTNGHRFGEFDIGTSSFTIAFVISTKDLDRTWHLTAGLDNTTHFNIHFGKKDLLNYNNFTIFPPNGGSHGDLSHYFNAKYCFLMYTFNHAQNNGECIRSLFNDVGNYGTSQDVYDNVYSLPGRDTFNSGNTSSRSFTLASSWNNRQSIKIFDMIILPEVSITTNFVSNVATDPNFGMILDYVSRHFGFTTGTA